MTLIIAWYCWCESPGLRGRRCLKAHCKTWLAVTRRRSVAQLGVGAVDQWCKNAHAGNQCGQPRTSLVESNHMVAAVDSLVEYLLVTCSDHGIEIVRWRPTQLWIVHFRLQRRQLVLGISDFQQCQFHCVYCVPAKVTFLDGCSDCVCGIFVGVGQRINNVR